MKCNVGGADQAVRIAGGLLSLGAGLGLFGRVNRQMRAGLLALGGAVLASGLSRYCPLNQALGIDTCHPSIGEAAEEAAEAMQHLAE